MDTSKRTELFEKMSALLAANGEPINDEVKSLMESLLNGSMNYAEHREMLEAMIRDLES